jgi:hypothetical protein
MPYEAGYGLGPMNTNCAAATRRLQKSDLKS